MVCRKASVFLIKIRTPWTLAPLFPTCSGLSSPLPVGSLHCYEVHDHCSACQKLSEHGTEWSYETGSHVCVCFSPSTSESHCPSQVYRFHRTRSLSLLMVSNHTPTFLAGEEYIALTSKDSDLTGCQAAKMCRLACQ